MNVKSIIIIIMLTSFFLISCETKKEANKETIVEKETTFLSLITLSDTEENPKKDFKYHINKCNTITIDEYIGDSEIIHFPDKIDGIDVTEIGKLPANRKVRGIYIESKISNVVSSAFETWTSVRFVYIENEYDEMLGNELSIGDYAFRNCDSLEIINIPYRLKHLGKNVFEGCDSLKSAKLNSLNNLLDGTFGDCSSLIEVYLGENIKIIKGDCFKDCSSLKRLTIPKSVIYIDNLPETLTLLVDKNSYAHKYAIKNNIKYEIVEISVTGINE